MGARGMTTVWRPRVRIEVPMLSLRSSLRLRCGGGVADGEGHEAEESPSHEGAMRARGEVPLEVQGVQRLSARS